MKIVLLGIWSDFFICGQITNYESIIRKGHRLTCVSDDVLLIYNQLVEFFVYFSTEMQSKSV